MTRDCKLFIRIFAFVSIILLFFSVSEYYPSVYAKMQVMKDDDLSQIDGEAGVTLGLNMSARFVANSITLSNNYGTTPDYISLGNSEATGNFVYIANGTGYSTPFEISTNVISDVGTNSSGTWLYTQGMVMPSSSAGIGVFVNSIIVNADGDRDDIGNLAITGIYLGRDVLASLQSAQGGINAGNITYTAGTSFMRISSRAAGTGTGIRLYASNGGYIDKVMYSASAGSNVTVSGIYMFSAQQSIASGSPNAWSSTTLTGNMLIGHNGTAEDDATIDIGNNGGATIGGNGVIMRLSLPNFGSLRVKNFAINGASLGPIAADYQVMTTLRVTIRNLNSSGY